MIHGLIFDCDGTLADTMPLHWRAWQVIAARHRLPLSRGPVLLPGRRALARHPEDAEPEQGLALDHLAVAREKEAAYLAAHCQVEPINAVVAIAREHYGEDAHGGGLRRHAAESSTGA